jgi:hypothetical protein
VTAAGLRVMISDLIVLLSGATSSPTAVTIVTLAGVGGGALWGVIMLLRKFAIPGLVDACARLQHVRGRNQARTKVANALAERGTPADLIRGLEVLGQVSPMDAPDASVYVGEAASIPGPWSSGTDGERRVVIVHPELPLQRSRGRASASVNRTPNAAPRRGDPARHAGLGQPAAVPRQLAPERHERPLK